MANFTKKQLKIALWAVLLSSSGIALSIKMLCSPPPFNLSQLYQFTEYHPEWEMAASEDKKSVHEILNQKFYYLGEGGQCFAFESSDRQFVLKMFKARHQRPRSSRPSLKKFLFERSNQLQKNQEKWRKRFLAACDSYKIAFEDLREETGVVFLHFNATQGHFSPIEVYDQQRQMHTIQLDQIPFFVQKKADLLTARLQFLTEQNDIQGVQKIISALENFIEVRAKKGISDRKQAFNINYGIIEGHIIQFDAGKIFKDERIKQAPEEEIQRVKNNFHHWLGERYPQIKEN